MYSQTRGFPDTKPIMYFKYYVKISDIVIQKRMQ